MINNSFSETFYEMPIILMEGAIGERLKKEYNIYPDNQVVLAAHIYNKDSRTYLEKIYQQYIDISKKYKFPLMLMTPTRRANKERVEQSIYSEEIIKDNVDFLKAIREKNFGHIYIGGLMGCKGDAYKGDEGLSIEEVYQFHDWQASLFKESEVDFLYAGIMPTLDESIGMAKALQGTGLPYIMSFMIGCNGKLLDGTTIDQAIACIDDTVDVQPLCYMTNCVHPNITKQALNQSFNQNDRVRKRFKGTQANTSQASPYELEHSKHIICSDVNELADEMVASYKTFGLKIFGGCCGTNDKYIEEIAAILKKEDIVTNNY